MAFVGLKYAAFAPLISETPGQLPTYGHGVVVGKMIGADITYTRNSEALYADDAMSESDNSMTGGTISLNLDDISDEANVAMLGMIHDEARDEYDETDTPSPNGGFGYIRVRSLRNKVDYIGFWIYKTQLAIASESASTKAQNVNWQTPTVTGNIMAAQPKADMKNHFRVRKVFSNEAEAYAWINTFANITTGEQ